MKTDTPETDAALKASNGQWSNVLKETCQRLERERDEAIRQREETNTSSKYSCDYNYEQKLKAERERDEARELLRLASIEANALATSIQKSEYSDVNDFELCDSVAGVISQINNMYAGVREQRDEAREDATNYYARIGELENERNEAIFVMRETRRRLDDAWLEIERLKLK